MKRRIPSYTQPKRLVKNMREGEYHNEIHEEGI